MASPAEVVVNTHEVRKLNADLKGSVESIADKELRERNQTKSPSKNDDKGKGKNEEKKDEKENKHEHDEEIDVEKLKLEHKDIATIDDLHMEQRVIAYGIEHIIKDVFQSMDGEGGESPAFTRNQRTYTLTHFSKQLEQMEVDQKKLKNSLDKDTRPAYIKSQNTVRLALLGRGLVTFAKTKAKSTDAEENHKLLMDDIFEYAFGATTRMHKGKDADESKKILRHLDVCKHLYTLALVSHPTREKVEKYFAESKINAKREVGEAGSEKEEVTGPADDELSTHTRSSPNDVNQGDAGGDGQPLRSAELNASRGLPEQQG